MKLIIAILQDKDGLTALNELNRRGFRATKLASTGGFLREGNTTLFLGVEDDQVETVVNLIGRLGRKREKVVTPMATVGAPMDSYVPFPVEVQIGGATIFTLPVERFERF